MVGLALMEQLSRALAPDARLVLIGDGDQLPAVEVGSVFRDLVATVRAIRLTESHRMNPADPGGRGRARRRLAPSRPATSARAALPAARRPDELAFAGFACLRAGRTTPRRRAARCPRSSITGTRPGSGPAPTPRAQSFALRAGRR